MICFSHLDTVDPRYTHQYHSNGQYTVKISKIIAGLFFHITRSVTDARGRYCRPIIFLYAGSNTAITLRGTCHQVFVFVGFKFLLCAVIFNSGTIVTLNTTFNER